MLEVQKYLRSIKASLTMGDRYAVEKLSSDLGIRATYHPELPLVILNYCHIDSPKSNPIVRECRGLTLEMGSWDVVARAFPRFFNAGEAPELEKKFDWDNFAVESKDDGSITLLYRYKKMWMVNTRASFAQGEISPGVGETWQEVFVESAIGESSLSYLGNWLDDRQYRDAITWVFELCSPYNKIVRNYQKPTAFLLSAFWHGGVEVDEHTCDNVAAKIGAERPGRYQMRSLSECVKWLEEQEDPTFEGFVLRDRHGLRIKVKNSRYVALHRLSNNGNIFNPKNLVPLALKGEQAEVLVHFPEVATNYFDVVEKLEGAKGRLLAVWEAAKGIEKQKDFAIYVNKHTTLSSILFEARKRKVEPAEVWKESAEVLLKKLF